MRPASPVHESALPDHVPPMVLPETRAEARLLAFLLNAGYFPTYKREEGASCEQEPDGQDLDLGLTEADLKVRGA